MNRKKCIILIMFCLAYNYIVNNYYRPYIYINKINDFGIADIGNNFTFIPGTYFVYFFSIRNLFFQKI